MIKAITFDFWNTLFKGPADAELADIRAVDVREVLARDHLIFDLGHIKRAFSAAWKKAFFMQRARGEEIGPRGQLEEVLAFLDINPAMVDREALYHAYTQTLLKLPPELNDNVIETLSLLQKRFKLAVICNTGASPGCILRDIMRDKGIADYFGILIFSDEVRFSKPDNRIFSLALNGLDAESKFAAHVGDDPITDIIGAKKAGMTAVWLAPNADWKTPEADYLIRDFGELQTLL